VREQELANRRVEREPVDAVAGRVDEDRRRAVDDVARRNTQGVRVLTLKANDAIADVARVVIEDEAAVEPAAEAPAEAPAE